MKEYKSIEINITYLEDCDCIRTSFGNDGEYNDNELPLLPFYP